MAVFTQIVSVYVKLGLKLMKALPHVFLSNGTLPMKKPETNPLI